MGERAHGGEQSRAPGIADCSSNGSAVSKMLLLRMMMPSCTQPSPPSPSLSLTQRKGRRTREEGQDLRRRPTHGSLALLLAAGRDNSDMTDSKTNKGHHRSYYYARARLRQSLPAQSSRNVYTAAHWRRGSRRLQERRRRGRVSSSEEYAEAVQHSSSGRDR